MTRRQSVPRQWLVIAERSSGCAAGAINQLPLGSGVLITAGAGRLSLKLRLAARRRKLRIVDEQQGAATRVHDPAEIRQARLRHARMVLLSPMFPTGSHPDWKPLPRMRAAALTRLCGTVVIALGGMDARRFRRIRRLGFHGWAGIDAWTRRNS